LGRYVGWNFAAKKRPLPRSAAQNLKRSYVLLLQTLQFVASLSVEGGGQFIATSLEDGAYGLPGGGKQIGFSFKGAYANEGDIKGEGKAFSRAHAYAQSAETSRAFSHGNRLYRI